MSQKQQAQPKSTSKTIFTLIGLLIMFIGPYLGSPEVSFPTSPRLEAMGFPVVDGMAIVSLTNMGWAAATIFVGALWLWIFVDTFWPSILALGVVLINPNFNAHQVMAQFFGNQTTFMIFFLFFFIALLMKSKVVNYISNYLLTRDFLKGRPWMLILTLMVATYLASWLEVVATVLILWPVTYFILSEAGVKPGEKLATFMVGNIIAANIFAVLGDIIKGPVLFMTSGYTGFVANNPQLGLEPINVASWILFTMIIAVCATAAILFAMRFIFRVDVSPLKNFDIEALKRNPLPPMNWKQKTTLAMFFIFVLIIVIPSILPPLHPMITYIKHRAFAGSVFLVVGMLVIKRNGEPLITFPEAAAGVPWGMFFLLATALFFGGMLTNPATNVPIMLELIISSALEGLSYIPFVLVIIVLALITTNLMNSIVAGIIIAPIIATVCLSYGFAPMPVVCLFLFVLMSALLTPAAGVPGALHHGNKEWLPGNAAVFYAVFFTIVMTSVTIVVGIPLAQILF